MPVTHVKQSRGGHCLGPKAALLAYNSLDQARMEAVTNAKGVHQTELRNPSFGLVSPKAGESFQLNHQ